MQNISPSEHFSFSFEGKFKFFNIKVLNILVLNFSFSLLNEKAELKQSPLLNF